MKRTVLMIASGLAWSCKGGGSDAGDADDGEPDVVLSTVSAEFDAEGEIVVDTCDGDVGDDLDLVLKLDQVSTGLQIFVDADVGWVPCDGSVEDFDCRWGNGPSDEPEEVWSWRLVGTTTGTDIEGTLSLSVTCDQGCEPCEWVTEFEGTLER